MWGCLTAGTGSIVVEMLTACCGGDRRPYDVNLFVFKPQCQERARHPLLIRNGCEHACFGGTIIYVDITQNDLIRSAISFDPKEEFRG